MGRHLKVPLDTKSIVGFSSALMSLWVVWQRERLWVAGILFVIAVVLVAHSIWEGLKDKPDRDGSGASVPTSMPAPGTDPPPDPAPTRWKDPGLNDFESRLEQRARRKRS